MKLSGVQSCSFGVRVSAVIATRAKRSTLRCFGRARANWFLTFSSESRPLRVRGLLAICVFSVVMVVWFGWLKCKCVKKCGDSEACSDSEGVEGDDADDWWVVVHNYLYCFMLAIRLLFLIPYRTQ